MMKINLFFVLVCTVHVANGALLDELRKAQAQLRDTQKQIADTEGSLKAAFTSLADPTNKDAITSQFTAAIEGPGGVNSVIDSLVGTWKDLKVVQDSENEKSIYGLEQKSLLSDAKWIVTFGQLGSLTKPHLDMDVLFLQIQNKVMKGACISDIFEVLPAIIDGPLTTIKQALEKLRKNFQMGASGLNPTEDGLRVYATLHESNTHFGNAIDRIQQLIDVLSRKKK